MIESTGKSLLKSLVDAKQQLHVAAKDFDSEDAFRQVNITVCLPQDKNYSVICNIVHICSFL